MAITIRKGSSYLLATRWEQSVVRYVPITNVSNTAPVVITAPAHGMPDGWRFAVSGIKGGGDALNAKHAPPKDRDYFEAKVLDEDTIEINAVNGAGWPAFVSGGILQFNLPIDLSDVSVVLQVQETAEKSSPVLIELSTANGTIFTGAEGMVSAIFSPADTELLEIPSAFFDMEITFSGGYFPGAILAYPKTEIIFEEAIT
jgi:hypothetical protein